MTKEKLEWINKSNASKPRKIKTGCKIDSYKKYLKEPSMPPSRGGDGSCLHQHYIEIDGETYSWFGFGGQQWIYKSETVSFEYVENGQYKNIIPETIETTDKNGNVSIPEQNFRKKRLRTVEFKMNIPDNW